MECEAKGYERTWGKSSLGFDYNKEDSGFALAIL
jgi:hypothetical protein